MNSYSENQPDLFTDIDKLYKKYLPLIQKQSVVRGFLDDDLYGELALAFMQCTQRFKFDAAIFMNAFDLYQQDYNNRKRG